MIERHRKLRERKSIVDIRNYIENGDDLELESITNELLLPIYRHLDCVMNISPNSVTQWSESKTTAAEYSNIGQALGRLIVQPLRENAKELTIGVALCNRPGVGVSRDIVQKQREVELAVQKPLIPDLLTGEISQRAYISRLYEHKDVYRPISQQLRTNYIENIDKMERLRDAAKAHLWPQLHGEWLPRLSEDPEFISDFNSLVDKALLYEKFSGFWGQTYTDFAFTGLGMVAGEGIGWVLGGGPFAGGAAGGLVGKTIDKMVQRVKEEHRKKTSGLVAFHQKLKRARI